MWCFIVLCVILIKVDADSDELKIFRKCCPEKHSLIKITVTENNNLENSFKCIDSVFVLADTNVTNPSSHLVVDASVVVQHDIPTECDLDIIHVSEYKTEISNEDVCYDRFVLEVIDGVLQNLIPKTVALKCNTTEVVPETKLHVRYIRKCCARGQIYDSEYHFCRKNSDETSNEGWLLNKINTDRADIYEFENGLNCKSDEYAIELKEKRYNMIFGSADSLRIFHKNGNTETNITKGNWCVDQDYTTMQLIARVCTRECDTFNAFCMRKCCPIGMHYLPNRCGSPASRCVPNTDDNLLFNLSTYMDPLRREYDIGDVMGFRSEIFCKTGKIALNISQPMDRHNLTKYGWLQSPLGLTNDYCLETFDTRVCNDQTLVTAVMCFIKPPNTKDFRISFILNCISAVCLLLTLIVYIIMPELRNLHGLNLICHVMTMLLAYSCLARVQYVMVADSNLCAAFGYGIYFGFVAAFAWLNVMCLDIWWTFGSVRTVQPPHKRSAGRRRFLWYSLYAWGISISLALVTYLLDRFPVSPILDANMGYGRCWFGSVQNAKSDWPHYIFFVIPMGLVSGVNFVLWLLTARHCARVKSEVHRLQAGSAGDRAKRRFRVDKANLVLTVKLWVVMGAGWICELLSTVFAKPNFNIPWIFILIDIVNELQGVAIFIILVFKRKVYYLIRKRLGLEKPDKQKNGASSSGRTSSTILSRTISLDERTNKRISMPNDNSKLQ
ncbi:hypothetical protein ACJJTC_001984 [Scirpophaga incertulas]